MADSVVYGAIMGSIFASLPALKTHVIAFDTEVVDLTEKCGDDPVNMLFVSSLVVVQISISRSPIVKNSWKIQLRPCSS